METKSVLILGLGYTGRHLKKLLIENFPQLKLEATTRDGRDGTHAWSVGDSFPSTKSKSFDCGFICFPPSLGFTSQFKKEFLSRASKWILVSSTGFFSVSKTDEIITEDSPLDMSLERVKAELELQKLGVITVYAAGIYGPGRDPRSWVLKGRVGRSEKFINLIQVEDLAQFLIQAMKYSEKGKRWIACDQVKYRWTELIDALGMKDIPLKESLSTSKKVMSQHSQDQLKVKLKYPDAAKAIQSLPLEKR